MKLILGFDASDPRRIHIGAYELQQSDVIFVTDFEGC